LKKLELGPRDAPRRWLTKQQAIRHLIHAAVRLIVAGEDPFATHLLIQSADKLLIDLAKHSATGKLALDWTPLMKPEYKDALLKVHRETFNFLKHADRDHDQTLHSVTLHYRTSCNWASVSIIFLAYRMNSRTTCDLAWPSRD
jgi:hypothetical protein